MVEEKGFRELFNWDILLKFWSLEFLVERIDDLRIGGGVTQISGTCGKGKNPCSHLGSKPGLQGPTYQFTDRSVLVGNNI